jgi:hypothetical protein
MGYSLSAVPGEIFIGVFGELPKCFWMEDPARYSEGFVIGSI